LDLRRSLAYATPLSIALIRSYFAAGDPYPLRMILAPADRRDSISRRLRATTRPSSSRLTAPPGSHAETWPTPLSRQQPVSFIHGQWIRTTYGVSWPSTSSTTWWSLGDVTLGEGDSGGGLFHGRVLSGRGPGGALTTRSGAATRGHERLQQLGSGRCGCQYGRPFSDHERRINLLVGC
jgi:hypothetical protein